MRAPPPSRRLVSSAPATLLLLSRLLLAGASDGAPPLVGVSPQSELGTSLCSPTAPSFFSLPHRVVSADEAYFTPQVIACRDGSGYFPRNRLNDGYCDCADGTDEPGTSACPEGKFYCRNIGDTPRLLFSSFVNDKICASLYLLYEQCHTYNMAIQLAYDPCSSQLPSCGPKQGQVFRRLL
ncbi:glucosidase 2 subunit beta-like isoform X4 [Phragmites australis]|uniref:glucosidase 2 subunit beta-like isoform X4 n=1 Tax=Phragmites australis TaxID=29695 RepID=UPI002D79437F|nr:glucosidase 2 subunit beta-like isoform X4 [Phragmites australis]